MIVIDFVYIGENKVDDRSSNFQGTEQHDSFAKINIPQVWWPRFSCHYSSARSQSNANSAFGSSRKKNWFEFKRDRVTTIARLIRSAILRARSDHWRHNKRYSIHFAGIIFIPVRQYRIMRFFRFLIQFFTVRCARKKKHAYLHFLIYFL